jgi:hypothetical protein
MAITVDGSGTQTATIGTEHTLYDSSAAASFELGVDLSAMQNGDVVEVRAYKLFKAAGTRRVVAYQAYPDAIPADEVGVISIPISTGLTTSGAVRFTLKQIQGTGRTFDWEVLKIA